MSKRRLGDGHAAGDGGSREASRHQFALLLLRVGLPVTLATTGIILLLVGSPAIGIVLVGTAIIAALVDLFARMTNESDLDRQREEQARSTFMRTGRWPGRRG